jgi:ribosomal protein S12 methylthiotransferase
MKLYVVSLGCPKNRVDSEAMAGILLQHGVQMEADAAKADILLVNTCSFILDAKEESVNTILELARLKQRSRKPKVLVVSGCLVQQHGADLPAELHEVDLFLGSGKVESIDQVLALAAERLGAKAVKGVGAGRLITSPGGDCWLPDPAVPRFLGDQPHRAYLKISDGCSRRCAFCAIPAIKGPLRNRSQQSVVEEARQLGALGVKELTLIAQDTSAFGGRGGLVRLLEELDEVEGPQWIRLLYLYPDGVTQALVDCIQHSKKVLPYADMPVQHIDAGLLRRMRRAVSEARVRGAVERLLQIKGLALRSSLIVGFPGETERAFAKLLSFVEEGPFHNLGVFVFSPEEGTEAAAMEQTVPRELAEERRGLLMEAQLKVSRRRNRALVGRKLSVLVEGPSAEHPWVQEGRCYAQAPDIDGVTFLELCDAPPGTILPCRITGSRDYDLRAQPL